MMMMMMRVPRPIVTLRFIECPFWMWRSRNKAGRAVVPASPRPLESLPPAL
jgi:hypothetical protein